MSLIEALKVGDLITIDFLVHMTQAHNRDLEFCLIIKKPKNEGKMIPNYYTVWSLKDMCFRYVGSHYIVDVIKS